MKAAKKKPAVKSDDIEIRKLRNPEPAVLRETVRSLTLFNEQNVGARRKTLFIGAYARGRSIGGIMLRWYGPDAYIDYLSIEEKWRKHGIGQNLMHAAEKELQRAKCRQVFVSTIAFQAPGFYRRMGYKLAATIPNYAAGHDQFIFRKTFPQKAVHGRK